MGKYLSNLAKSLMGELRIAPSKDLEGHFPLVLRHMRRMNAETLGKIVAAHRPAKIRQSTIVGLYLEGHPLSDARISVDDLSTSRELLVGIAALQVYAAMYKLREDMVELKYAQGIFG